jgi:hypothetical protein
LLLCLVFQCDKSGDLKANPLLGWAKGSSENDVDWMQSYKRQMRRFNLEVILAALIALTISIVLLLTAWEAFQKSMPLGILLNLLTALRRNSGSSVFEAPWKKKNFAPGSFGCRTPAQGR